MTLNEPGPPPVRRLPKPARIALVISAVLAVIGVGAAALAFGTSGTPRADATTTANPEISLSFEPSPSPVPSPSLEPSATPTSATPSAKPSKPATKPAPPTPLTVLGIKVTTVHSDGDVVATIKATTTGSGSATVRVIFFFKGATDVEKHITITGSGSGTITTTVSTPAQCVPGYAASIVVVVEDNWKVQDSVDIC